MVRKANPVPTFVPPGVTVTPHTMAGSLDESRSQTAPAARMPAPHIPGGAEGIVHEGVGFHQPGIPVGTSVVPEDPSKPKAPRPRRYEVLATRNVLYNGLTVPIREGKIFSEHEYDVRLLVSQGVRLREIKDEEPALAAG